MQMSIVPAIGISYSNLGSKMGFNGIGFDQPVSGRPQSPSSASFELPSTWRYGISCKFGLVKNENEFKQDIITITPSLEKEKIRSLDAYTKLGVELNLLEIIYLRTGKIELFPETSTWGISLSSMGLLKTINLISGNNDDRHNNHFLIRKLEIKYSFAENSFEDNIYPNITYHEIILNFFLL
jgi:hypothetical protein